MGTFDSSRIGKALSGVDSIPQQQNVTIDGTNATFMRHLRLVRAMVKDTPGTDEQAEEKPKAAKRAKIEELGGKA